MIKDKQKTVFLTGATGLVGSYLLKILLQEGYKVYVLARGKDNKNARDRVTDVLKFWDKDVLSRKSHNLPQKRHAELGSASYENDYLETLKRVQGDNLSENLIVLEGDITEKNLGLNKQNIDLLKNEIEEIFHSAAVTQFNWPLEKIRKVNVDGTKNVLEMAVKCNENNPPESPYTPLWKRGAKGDFKGGQGGFSEQKGKFKKVNHVSTAYVCGDYKGIFKEEDLDVGQTFNSTYEQSKFEAEKLVEKYRKKGLWIDIFRPPLVVGESKTGKTITFQQSVYQLLHMWNLEIFDYFPGKGFFINTVFVDDLCNAIFKISSQTSSPDHYVTCGTKEDENTPPPSSPPIKGGEIRERHPSPLVGEGEGEGDFRSKNYHPFNCKVAPLEAIIDVSSKYLGFKKPKLISRNDFFKNNPTPAQKMLLQNNILLFNNEAKLNSKMTNKVLKKYGFEFSNFNRDSFLKLLEYCVKEGFLKSNVHADKSAQ